MKLYIWLCHSLKSISFWGAQTIVAFLQCEGRTIEGHVVYINFYGPVASIVIYDNFGSASDALNDDSRKAYETNLKKSKKKEQEEMNVAFS